MATENCKRTNNKAHTPTETRNNVPRWWLIWLRHIAFCMRQFRSMLHIHIHCEWVCVNVRGAVLVTLNGKLHGAMEHDYICLLEIIHGVHVGLL